MVLFYTYMIKYICVYKDRENGLGDRRLDVGEGGLVVEQTDLFLDGLDGFLVQV